MNPFYNTETMMNFLFQNHFMILIWGICIGGLVMFFRINSLSKQSQTKQGKNSLRKKRCVVLGKLTSSEAKPSLDKSDCNSETKHKTNLQ
jgi:hypothetical protein